MQFAHLISRLYVLVLLSSLFAGVSEAKNGNNLLPVQMTSSIDGVSSTRNLLVTIKGRPSLSVVLSCNIGFFWNYQTGKADSDPFLSLSTTQNGKSKMRKDRRGAYGSEQDCIHLLTQFHKATEVGENTSIYFTETSIHLLVNNQPLN